MLILAAVAINLTIGENGIFTRAQNAVDKYEIAAIEEKMEMYTATSIIDEVNGDNPSMDFIKGMYSFFEISNNEEIIGRMDLVINLDNELYRINVAITKNGEIKIESGYKIDKVEDMAKVMLLVMNEISDENIEIIYEGRESTVVKYNNVTYIIRTIYETTYAGMYIDYYDGYMDINPGEFVGKGTEESPYLIQSIEDLVGFSNKSVNDNFYNKYIYLATDLDFNSDESYVNPNTTEFGDINENGIIEPLKTELTTGAGFRPISSSLRENYYFGGNFDGNNHTISNIYINRDDVESVGFFAYVNEGEISNLRVTGNITSAARNLGGIVGYMEASLVENCVNEIELKGNEGMCIGGIGGNLVYGGGTQIIDCENHGNINLELLATNIQPVAVGGIVGAGGNLILDGCKNYGTITAKADITKLYKGDIYGNIDSNAYVEIHENCSNNGKIEIEEISEEFTEVYIGGIIGKGVRGVR